MAEPSTTSRVSRSALVLLAVLCCAQLLWIVGEYGAARRAAMEAQARNPGSELTALLRQEVESAERHLAIVSTQAEMVLKDRVRHRVEEAVAVATSIHAQAAATLPPETIKSLIREALRSPRFFDGRGYYFIDDLKGNCVLLPTVPRLEGGSLMENRDDAGRYIMRELLHAVDNSSGAGYVRYSWYPPNVNNRMDDKIAYAALFQPYGWLIGTGDYVSAVEDGLKAEALERFRALRLPQGGRLAVIDQNGIVRLSPEQPSLEGGKLENLPDDQESQALRHAWNAARSGAGAARFGKASPDSGRQRDWYVWSQTDPTFGWVVAAMAAGPDQTDATHFEFWRFTGRFVLPGILMVTALVWVVALWLASQRGRHEP